MLSSVSTLVSPIEQIRYGRSPLPAEVARKRGIRAVDINADWFDSDLCIGYNSTFFCDLNILHKIKDKKSKTVLIIKDFVIKDKEKKAIYSGMVDEVWIINYVYSDDLMENILSLNLMQKTLKISDFYGKINKEKKAFKKALFSVRKTDTDIIKSKSIKDAISSKIDLDMCFLHEIIDHKLQLLQKYDLIILYATTDFNGDELRVIDYCDKNSNTVINRYNELVFDLYHTYLSVEDISDMVKNYDKVYYKDCSVNCIGMKKAVIDIIQRR